MAALWLIERAADELLLFAVVGLLLGGLDDLAVDLIWVGRTLWRRATIYRRFERAHVASLPAPSRPGRTAVFVGAWDEAGVIGKLLRTALARWGAADFRIYVGVYPNDQPTIDEVEAVAREDPRVRVVLGLLAGPTTKAEALNRCWDAMFDDERGDGVPIKAIVLHDAEDVVHRDELTVFASLIDRFELIQLPVLPILDRGSRWVGGHYQDEFAEAHAKQLIVREAIGAGVPLAGTGCAIARAALQRLADANGGLPFDAASLTEDYETGLRLRDAGARVAFVRITSRAGGRFVAVQAHFPATYRAAVIQKARWIGGIAFAGWDRLGWTGGMAEAWMRLRDRRAPLAALVIAAGYAGVALLGLAAALRLGAGLPVPATWRGGWVGWVLALLLGWRLAMRFAFVRYCYGWREGMRSIPRMAVANVILVASAWRALHRYARRAPPVWDKTAHVWPSVLPAE